MNHNMYQFLRRCVAVPLNTRRCRLLLLAMLALFLLIMITLSSKHSVGLHVISQRLQKMLNSSTRLSILPNQTSAKLSPPMSQLVRIVNPDTTIASLSSLQQTTVIPVERRIPTVIHQSWRDANVPVKFLPWIGSWKINHPTWRYVLWTDKLMRKFVAERFPAYLKTYDAYKWAIGRADAFRYFLLYEYGGIYADLDMESLKPLDKLLLSNDCILSQEPEAHSYILNDLERPLPCNAFMMCRPHHPFFKYAIDNLERFRYKEGDPVTSTGPRFLYKILAEYQKLQFANTSPLLIGAQDDFMPTFDRTIVHKLIKGCLNKTKSSFNSRQTCKKLQASRYRNIVPTGSYSTHHWVHTWLTQKYKVYGMATYVNVKKIIPDTCFGMTGRNCSMYLVRNW